MDNDPSTVIDTAPSGEATGANEVEIRDALEEDNEKKEKEKETDKTPNSKPVVDSSSKLLAIDTCQVEKKSIIEMNPTELMMMVAQKLMKEGFADKGIIDQSITFLHRLIPECMIENEASPSGKLKALT